jgi:hypothetical protein
MFMSVSSWRTEIHAPVVAIAIAGPRPKETRTIRIRRLTTGF